MSLSAWVLYLSFVLVSTLSPGPAVLLSISNSVSYGPRASVLSTLGNLTGLGVLAVASMAGVGAMLAASHLLFSVLKAVGAGYLVWLGVMRWTAPPPAPPGCARQHPAGAPRRASLYTQGASVALTNPKALLFFGALFPQFVAADRPLTAQFLHLLAPLLAMSFTALMGYAFLARLGAPWLAGGARWRWFQRGAGTLFIALAFALLGWDAGTH